jgi:hypothetical protein
LARSMMAIAVLMQRARGSILHIAQQYGRRLPAAGPHDGDGIKARHQHVLRRADAHERDRAPNAG